MPSSGTLRPGSIERENPMPYYAQLAGILRRGIERGEHKSHSQIPSEAELERTYGVSRTVVRQALGQLMHEGLLYRRKGKGTFVAESKYTVALFQSLVSFYDEMAARGHPPLSKVLTQERTTAPGEVAAALRLDRNGSVIKISRLRSVDGEPVVLSTSYVPYDFCPALVDEDLSQSSLYRVMEQKFGLRIASGVRRIEAIAAAPRDARMLRYKVGAPLLVVESTVYLHGGRAVEFSISKHRADRTTFEARLVRVFASSSVSGPQGTASHDGKPDMAMEGAGTRSAP